MSLRFDLSKVLLGHLNAFASFGWDNGQMIAGAIDVLSEELAIMDEASLRMFFISCKLSVPLEFKRPTEASFNDVKEVGALRLRITSVIENIEKIFVQSPNVQQAFPSKQEINALNKFQVPAPSLTKASQHVAAPADADSSSPILNIASAANGKKRGRPIFLDGDKDRIVEFIRKSNTTEQILRRADPRHWSKEEDDHLLDCIAESDGTITDVSNRFQFKRSKDACEKRAQILHKCAVDFDQEDRLLAAETSSDAGQMDDESRKRSRKSTRGSASEDFSAIGMNGISPEMKKRNRSKDHDSSGGIGDAIPIVSDDDTEGASSAAKKEQSQPIEEVEEENEPLRNRQRTEKNLFQAPHATPITIPPLSAAASAAAQFFPIQNNSTMNSSTPPSLSPAVPSLNPSPSIASSEIKTVNLSCVNDKGKKVMQPILLQVDSSISFSDFRVKIADELAKVGRHVKPDILRIYLSTSADGENLSLIFCNNDMQKLENGIHVVACI